MLFSCHNYFPPRRIAYHHCPPKISTLYHPLLADEIEIAPGAFGSAPANAVLMDLNQRAQAYGFTYKPVNKLLEAPDIEDLVSRIEALQAAKGASPQKIANDAAALLSRTPYRFIFIPPIIWYIHRSFRAVHSRSCSKNDLIINISGMVHPILEMKRAT